MRIDGAIDQLTSSLKDLRTLAQGIHPSLLTEGGLTLALPELTGRCPIPTELAVGVTTRLPPLVESTVYFVVSEALANAAKHSAARRCWVRLERVGAEVELVVRDNGRGGADVHAGTGMQGIIDRVEAVSGTLTVTSHPGEGTTLRALIPIDPNPPST